MGYYTGHELSIFGHKDTEEGEKILKDIEEDEALNYAFNSGEPTKSYDLDVRMKEFSKKHPHIMFVVYGNGEESGDLWIEKFKNGKSCRKSAVIPEITEDELV